MNADDASHRIPAQVSAAGIWTGRFTALFFAGGLYFLVIGMSIPVLPAFLANDLGGSELDVGIAVGAIGWTAALLRPVAGSLGDSYGLRTLVIGGCLLVGISTFGNLAAQSPLHVVGLRLIGGIGEAAVSLGLLVAAVGLVTDERQGEATSFFGIAVYGGLGVGPLIGTLLASNWSADAVWLVGGLIALLVGVLSLAIPAAPERSGSRVWPQRLMHPVAWRPGIVVATSVVGWAAFVAFIPRLSEEFGDGRPGVIFAVFSATVVVMRALTARASDRFGSVIVARAGLSLAAIGLALIGISGSPTGIYLGTVCFAAGETLLYPAVTVLVIRAAPAGERTEAVAFYTIFQDIALGLGAIAAGVVVWVSGMTQAAFLLGAGSNMVGVFLTRILRPTDSDRPINRGTSMTSNDKCPIAAFPSGGMMPTTHDGVSEVSEVGGHEGAAPQRSGSKRTEAWLEASSASGALYPEIDYEQDGKHLGNLRIVQPANVKGWQTLLIPVISVRNGEGPTLLLLGGTHGDEVDGPVVLMKLAHRLQAQEIHGRIIILPALNYAAVEACERGAPPGGRDLNRNFPGRPDGTAEEMIANYLDSVLLPMSDLVLDLHSGGQISRFLPSLWLVEGAEPSLWNRTLEAAQAFGAPYTTVSGSLGGDMSESAARRGCAYLSTEAGGGTTVDRKIVAMTQTGIYRLMAHLGLIQGAEAPSASGPMRVRRVPESQGVLLSSDHGLFEPMVDLGDEVAEGQTVGHIHRLGRSDYEPVEVIAPTAGLIYGLRWLAHVRRGDWLVIFAVAD